MEIGIEDDDDEDEEGDVIDEYDDGKLIFTCTEVRVLGYFQDYKVGLTVCFFDQQGN